MSNFKKKRQALPFVRDPYLAFLVNGARRTEKEGYPIIEGWMVADKPPDDLIQWDVKSQYVGKEDQIGISFYCTDNKLAPVLNNPMKYIELLSHYQCVVGMDASPYDNMPPVVQKSQIYCNLAVTYYFGKNGIKIIPNVRVGTSVTYDSLQAYPKRHLIAIGTNGFTNKLDNRMIFKEQVEMIVNTLEPSGIVVYGTTEKGVFTSAIERGIQLYQYDSFMMKRNKDRRKVI